MFGFRTRLTFLCASLVWIVLVNASVGFTQEVASSPATPTPAAETPAPATPTPSAEAAAAPAEAAPAATPAAADSPSNTPAPEPAANAEPESPATERVRAARQKKKAAGKTDDVSAVKVAVFKPETSYTKLAHPDIAKRVGLSDEQRAKVSALLSERSAALQETAGDADAELLVKLKYEQMLSEVLTPQQLATWPDKVEQRSLRFNFRFQLWTDVLEWFAEEADLSLVMNNPPPGTFNYSDPKQYTPEEAIDVLNSVLLTHGFTLIRRDKMLIVQDLSQGIPDGLIPVVDVAELDRRGDFELVTVRIPLGKREDAAVLAEITPIKGAHGQIVPLPTTRQLLITDTARNVKAMAALVEAIPEPKPPKAAAAAAAPPPPELVVYPITNADPVAAQDILLKMVPTATMEFDAKRSQLYVYTTPNLQTTVAKVLENIEADLPPERARTLEIYSIKDVARPAIPQPAAAPTTAPAPAEQIIYDSRGRPRYRMDAYGRRVPISAQERALLMSQPPTAAAPTATTAPTTELGPSDSLLRTLQDMVPSAELHLDQKGARLMAFATPEEHEIIKSVIEKLGGAATEDEVPLIEVYAIAHSDPDALKTMFESLFPGVQINIDKATNSMVVFAYPSEHTSVKETLDRLMPKTADGQPAGIPSGTELRFYPLKDVYPPTLETVLAGLVPNASVTYDTYNSRLIVVGSATDHEIISRGVEELETAKAKDRSKLIVYPVTPTQKTRFAAVLESLVGELPGVIVLPDARATELAIWATALHHEAIAGILEQFKGEGAAAEGEYQMVAYPVKAADPATVQSMLEELFPDVRMLIDAKGTKLLVWTTTTEHERIKKAISSIISEPPPEEQPRFETYTIRSLERRSAATLRAFESHLTELVPNAQVTLDVSTGELIVWGSPEDQSLVQAAIERLGHGNTPENTPTLKVYPLEDLDPTTVQTLLTRLVRQAELSLDATSNKLIAMAIPADQEMIQKTLEELAASDVPENEREVRFHTLEHASATEVITVLQGLVPKAQVTVDATTGRLMVVAKPSDHDKVLQTITEMEEGSTSKAELRFIELQEALPPTVLTLLSELAPRAQITPDAENDRLMVMATAEDHAKITETIAKVEEAGSTKPELRFYPTEDELPSAVLSILATLAPKAQITPDASGKYLTVVASPADHEIIKSTIEQATTTLPAEEKEKLVVYPVTNQQQTRFQAVLTSVQAELPSVRVIPDSTPGQLSIWAKPSEHEVLAGIIEELTQELPPEEKFQLVAYGLKAADPASVTQVLGELFPNTRVTLDAKSNRLLIWTKAAEHEAIRRALDEIDVEGPAEEQRRFEIYAINGVAGLSAAGRAAKAADFLASLQTLVPNAKLTIDSETGDLVVFGTPTEHEIIRTAVEKLGKFRSAAHTPQLEVHELTTADPTTTVPILEGLVPRAEITVDTANNRLIVLAPPDAQMTIRNTLAQLQSTDPGANDPQVRVINLKQKASEALTDVLAQLVPDANVTIDEEGKRLVVVAKAADHEVVERTVQQIDGALGEEEENALMVYPVSPGQRKRFEAVVESLGEDLPNVKVIADDEPTQVSVWAKPSEHQMIGEILMQLKAGATAETQKRFEAYSIQGAVGYETTRSGRLTTATTLMTGLQELVPDVKLMIDYKNDKLVAWASPEEHKMLKAAVEKLAPMAGGENTPRLQVYTLSKKAPAGLVDGLQKLVPEAEVSIDTAGTSLTVVATGTEQQMVQDAVDRLEKAASGKSQPYFEAYELRGLSGSSPTLQYYSARNFMASLQPLVPDANLSIDFESKSLIAFATAEEQATLKTAVEKLTRSGPDNTPNLQVYKLKQRPSDSLMDGLEKLTPEAEFSLSEEGGELTVVATTDEHSLIKSALEKIDAAVSETEQPYFEVYTLAGVSGTTSSSRYYSANAFMNQLEPFAPNAKMSMDFETGDLLVLASPSEHEAIKTAVARIDTGKGDAKPQLEIYTLETEIPDTLEEGLEQLVPRAKISIDEKSRHISVVASAEDHQAIRETLDKIEKAAGAKGKPYFKVYAITAINTDERWASSRYYAARNMMDRLEELVPNAKVSIDYMRGNLLVFGTEEEHKAVENAIAQLDDSGSEEDPETLVVYRLSNADERAVYYLLRALVPKAKLSMDYRADSVMAIATAGDHKKIKELIDQLDFGPDNPNAPQLQFYTLREAPSRSLLQGLGDLASKAEISYDADSRQLMVIATANEHAIIAKNLSKIQETAAAEAKTELKVYEIDSAEMTTVETVLEDLYPDIRIQLDTKNDRMIITAMPDQHEGIAKAIETMDADEGGSEEKTVAYAVSEVDVNTAISILQSLVDDMKLYPDATGSKIVAYGRERDHKIVAEAIEQMEEGPDEAHKPYLMVYPTGDADPTILTQVLSNLAPKANVVVDTKSESLAVFAVAKDQETVKSAIESMAITAMGTGKPMAMTYSLKELPATNAIQILQLAVPEAQVAMGADTQQLIVWANAKDQATIKTTLEALDVEAPEGSKRTAAAYHLEGINPNYSYYSMLMIQRAVPGASITLSADRTQVVAWASPKDHEAIKQIVKSIVEETPEMTPVMEIYALETVDALVAIKILKDMVPDAELSVGSDAGQLVAWARPKDQERIKSALDKLTASDASPTAPTMEVYKLESGDAVSAMKVLGKIVPEADLSVGDDAGQLIAWARPADHKKIKEAVTKLDAAGPKPTMKIYNLEKLEALSALSMLRSVVPEAEGSIGSDPRQLVVWATEEQHAEVENMIEQMSAEAPEGKAPIAVTYQLDSLNARTAEQILEEVAPSAKFTEGEDEYQLIIWARPDEHSKIETTLERIDIDGGGGKEEVRIYELDGDTRQLYYIARFLAQVVDKARFTPGATPNQLVAWARPKDHEQIQKLIDTLEDEENAPSAIVYDCGNVPAATVTLSLRYIAPQAVVTAGPTPSELVVWAAPKDHEKVKEVVDQMTAAEAPEKMPTAVVYTLEEISTTTATQMLRLAVPQAQVSPGAETYQLLVWAKPKDHEKVKTTLEQIDVEGPEDKQAKVVSYTLDGTSSIQNYYTMRFLAQSIPTARFTQGVQPDQIIAWAQPKVHEEIAELIEQVQGGEENAPKPVVYELKNVTAASVLTMLRSVARDAIPMVGTDPYQLIVWGRGEDHEKVKQLVDELSAAESPEMAPRAITYTLEEINATTAMQILQLAVPQARVSQGAETYQLLVWARPDDQKKVEDTLKQIDVEGPEDKQAKAVSYTLDGTSSTQNYYTMRFLAQSIPTARFTQGVQPDQIIAWAQPKVHEEIAELIEQVQGGEENAPKPVVYALKNVTAASVLTMLRSVAPQAVPMVGTDPYQLVVWGRGEDQEKVKQLVDELSAAESPEMAPRAITYTLEEINVTTAMQILQLAVPQARVSQGAETYQLLVWARPDDQKKVEDTLKQIDVEGPEDKQAKAVSYTLDGTNATQNYYAMIFLAQSIPTARFTQGVLPNQIIAWAQPKIHEEIAELIEQIQGGEENAPKPVIYNLRNTSAATVTVMLRQMVPNAIASVGTDPYELVVWARGDDHEKIQDLVDELSMPEPPETAPVPANYTVEEITAVAAMAVLRSVVPQAQLTPGADQYQFVALARPDDHELIKETLAKIDIDGPEDKQAKLAIYDLKNMSATSATTMIRQIAPTALATVGANPYQLIVWARPDEHEEIQKAVDQMAAEDTPENAFQAITYSLEEVSTTTATQILQLAVPQAQVSPGAETYQLVIWARPDDHKRVEEILEQIDVEGPEDKEAKAIAYTLDGSNATQNYYILRFLAQSVPTARFTMGVESDQIIAWAQPKIHEEIAELIKQIQGGEGNQPEAKVYALKNVTSTAVSVMLRQVVPEAVSTQGTDPYQMVIWARPDDHEKIQQIVDELSATDDPERAPKAVTYTLEEVSAQSAMAMLRLAVPQAQLSIGAEPYQLIVWARPDDQVLVEQTLEQIDVKGPDDKLAKVVVYDLGVADIRQMIYVLRFLQSAVPEGRFTMGASAKEIVAWARPKDHVEIQKLVDEFAETPESAPRVAIYSLENTTAASAMQLLASTFPMARFSIGTDAYQLIAWAGGDDHEKIAEAVKELSQKESEATAPRMIVYPLESANATQAMSILRTIVPEAQFGIGANTRQLIAWARPADHEKIKKVVEEMGKEEPEETAARVQVYTVETVDAMKAMSVLATAVPEAMVSAGNDDRQLVVFARPSEHEKVKATLEQLSTKGPEELQPKIVIYSLPTEGASHAMQVLQPVVPQAKFTLGTDPSKLIAWAYPEDHAIIKAAVDQIEADSWLDGNRVMSVYPMKPEDVTTFMGLLDPAILQHAQLVPDSERECLIVWADKRYDEAIKRTVAEFQEVVPEIVEPTAVVYRFEKTDIYTAYNILQTLVPKARIAYDMRSGSLVATALPEDHEKIRQTIEEMNRDALEMAPRLQVHQITSADPARVLQILTNLFRGEYNVQLSMDEANDSLIAYASPIQQEKIVELIAEIEKGAKLDTANRLKLYDLKNVDGYAAESVLADMFQRQGVRVDLTVDRYRNQLIAMARPEQHDKIAEVLEQFRIEDRVLEIFQLDYVDLNTANLAIRRLFADESYLSQPEVDPDPATGQLFVKASAAQLEEIRKLLIRMGETNLAPVRRSGSGNLRVVPFKGDTKKVLEEIQKVWPSLRPNEIRVVTPDDLKAPPVEDSKPKKEPRTSKKKKGSAKPAESSGPKDKTGHIQRGNWIAPVSLVSTSAGAPAPAQEDAEAPADERAANDTSSNEPAAEPEQPAEVLIIAGEGSFTIASEDEEALNELESLLRTISARSGFAHRNYSVFQIQNTTASDVAKTLQQLFQSRDPRASSRRYSRYGYGSSYGYGQTQVPLIVPDDRLNTILVKGTRADRQTIEGLLEIIDTPEMAESVAAAYEPKMIPLKHTDASRVMQMIQTVYRSYFTTAAATSNFSPQLTVDEITNSLIVKAPPHIVEDITKFAENLDVAADENAAEKLRVIPLKKANSARAQEMLNALLRGGGGYRASPYRAYRAR